MHVKSKQKQNKSIREGFFFGSRQLKVAEMDGRAGA